jgi:hypothetical protein
MRKSALIAVQGIYWYWAQGNSPHKFVRNTTLRIQKVVARGSDYSIKGFWVGWCEVTGISALSGRLEIDSCIVVHKKSPLNKLLNKRPRISGKENNINKPLNITTQKNPLSKLLNKRSRISGKENNISKPLNNSPRE